MWLGLLFRLHIKSWKNTGQWWKELFKMISDEKNRANNSLILGKVVEVMILKKGEVLPTGFEPV